MNSSRRTLVLAAFAAALLAGCVSTSLQTTWSDPAFTGGPFKTYFVMGLSERNVTARRVFEDVMVARLKASGANAVPAYQYLDGDGPADERAIDAAVAKSGADAVLMARLVGVDNRVNVSTAMVPGPMMGPGFGWYGAYSGWYAVPQVTQYQVAIVETSVFDVRTKSSSGPRRPRRSTRSRSRRRRRGSRTSWSRRSTRAGSCPRKAESRAPATAASPRTASTPSRT